MYVVIFDGAEGWEKRPISVGTLEQAFAKIVCHCGLSYWFEQDSHGWKLTLTNVERPEYSPDPITSDYVKPKDAKYHLMEQAVDGRLMGHVALRAEDFERARIMRNAQGTSVHVA